MGPRVERDRRRTSVEGRAPCGAVGVEPSAASGDARGQAAGRIRLGRPFATVREVLRYRDMLRNLVRRDLVVRYQRSALGVLLALGVPILATIVFTALFARLMPERDPAHYPFLVFVGYMAWDYFARSVSISVDVLRGHASLIGRVAFPLAVLPFSVCIAVAVQLGLGLALGTAANAVWGSGVHTSLLSVPLWVAIELLLVTGVALVVSVLGVLFRDFAQLVLVLLMLLFYATPVFWAPEIVPAVWLRDLLFLNPLYHVVLGLREAVVLGRFAPPQSIAYAAAWAVVAFAVGCVTVRRARWRITEEIG